MAQMSSISQALFLALVLFGFALNISGGLFVTLAVMSQGIRRPQPRVVRMRTIRVIQPTVEQMSGKATSPA